jgi:Cu+-exporting ATPase
MSTMQIIGSILIVGIVGLFFLWLRFQRRQSQARVSGEKQEVTILVRGAYDPNVITARLGIPLTIYFNRQENADCSRFVTIVRKDLKPFAMTAVTITPKEAGEYHFACDMGMYQGKIIVA